MRLLNFPGTVEKGLGKVLGMFEGGGALGPIMDMAKSMFNMPIDSQMINEKLGLNFTTIIRNFYTYLGLGSRRWNWKFREKHF